MGGEVRTKHVGMAPYRLSGNPEEAAIAKAWQEHNDSGNTLAWLLDPEKGNSRRPPEPSERDVAVAATVVQWLGSPVGQCFLRDLGYRKVDE
jgi:hypothetical protein